MMYKNMSTEELIAELRDGMASASLILAVADRLEEYEEQCIAFGEILPTCEGCSGKTEDGVRTDACVYAINNLYCMKRARENYFAMKAKVEELTDENERLRAETEQWRKDWSDNQRQWDEAYEKLEAENAEQDEAIIRALKHMGEVRREARAATAQKMHSEIKERCIAGGIYPAFVANVIAAVAKELTEGT